MEQWQRRRHPDDVPTPIAVAVADFCRRARGQAPASVVREALAVLSDDDDFRVKELTDAEPSVRPLGPFAVVDVVSGTAPAVAAQRELTGYYDLVRSMAAKTEAPARPSPPPPAPVRKGVKPKAGAEVAREGRKQKKVAATIAQKIAPKKRLPAAAASLPPPAEVASPWKKRQLPTPRGKFTRIEAEASRFDELYRPAARDELLGLIAQTGNRISLRKTLERQYVVRRGVGPSPDDIDALLEHHKLSRAIARQEREAILSSLTENHGALVKVADAMALNAFELDRLIAVIGVRGEVTEIRDRWVREALSIRNLPMRLEMLGRGKYLADLKIVRRFKEALVRDVLELLEELPVMADLEQLVTVAAKRHALNPESLRTAIDRLGIETQLDFQPASET
ncbi:MAG: hypothetical protein H6Q89_2490 [Myxococcaceae bacterium]|nr:hypothetical protein [Myxococcaceae bacterium]